MRRQRRRIAVGIPQGAGRLRPFPVVSVVDKRKGRCGSNAAAQRVKGAVAAISLLSLDCIRTAPKRNQALMASEIPSPRTGISLEAQQGRVSAPRFLSLSPKRSIARCGAAPRWSGARLLCGSSPMR